MEGKLKKYNNLEKNSCSLIKNDNNTYEGGVHERDTRWLSK